MFVNSLVRITSNYLQSQIVKIIKSINSKTNFLKMFPSKKETMESFFFVIVIYKNML